MDRRLKFVCEQFISGAAYQVVNELQGFQNQVIFPKDEIIRSDLKISINQDKGNQQSIKQVFGRKILLNYLETALFNYQSKM